MSKDKSAVLFPTVYSQKSTIMPSQKPANLSSTSQEKSAIAIMSQNEENYMPEMREHEPMELIVPPSERQQTQGMKPQMQLQKTRYSSRAFLGLLGIGIIGILVGALIEVCQQYAQLSQKYQTRTGQLRETEILDQDLQNKNGQILALHQGAAKQEQVAQQQLKSEQLKTRQSIAKNAAAEQRLDSLNQTYQDLQSEYRVLTAQYNGLVDDTETLKSCVAKSDTVIRSMQAMKAPDALFKLLSKRDLEAARYAFSVFDSDEFTQVGNTLEELFNSWRNPEGACQKASKILSRPNGYGL
jgi:uncharacterized phage infection (PIP) family protein YhgE